MSTLFQQLRAVTLGNLHDVLDRVVDLNSPSAIRQYVRDLENAKGKLSTELAVQTGQKNTLIREQKELIARVEVEKTAIKSLLTTQPDVAKAKASLVILKQKQADEYTQRLADQDATINQLSVAVTNIQAKHDEALANLRKLESLDRTTKAKESGASAILAANSALGSMGSDSVDDIQGRMQRRADVANAKFDQAVQSNQPDPVNNADVDALLASLKG